MTWRQLPPHNNRRLQRLRSQINQAFRKHCGHSADKFFQNYLGNQKDGWNYIISVMWDDQAWTHIDQQTHRDCLNEIWHWIHQYEEHRNILVWGLPTDTN